MMQRNLYSRYVAAMQFFNARLEEKHARENARFADCQRILSEEEFPAWWALVSLDQEAQQRWLERFEDPAGALTRTRNRITDELEAIPVGRVAA